jgi:hypothetical protein
VTLVTSLSIPASCSNSHFVLLDVSSLHSADPCDALIRNRRAVIVSVISYSSDICHDRTIINCVAIYPM